jgi:hypothetical protein
MIISAIFIRDVFLDLAEPVLGLTSQRAADEAVDGSHLGRELMSYLVEQATGGGHGEACPLLGGEMAASLAWCLYRDRRRRWKGS